MTLACACLLCLFVMFAATHSPQRNATTLVALYPLLCAVGPQGCPVHLGAVGTGTQLVSELVS